MAVRILVRFTAYVTGHGKTQSEAQAQAAERFYAHAPSANFIPDIVQTDILCDHCEKNIGRRSIVHGKNGGMYCSHRCEEREEKLHAREAVNV